MASINCSSLRFQVISLCVQLRGPGRSEIAHHLDLDGFEFKETVLDVTLHTLVKLGLLYKERGPCKCCKRLNTHYFASDAARIAYL